MIYKAIEVLYFNRNTYFGTMGKRDLKEVMIINAAEQVFEVVGLQMPKWRTLQKQPP
jgi:hypothetical protein